MRGGRRRSPEADGFGAVVLVLSVVISVGLIWLLENFAPTVFDVIPLLMIALLVYAIVQFNQMWRSA